MSYPIGIYPTWENESDYDGPEDYSEACAIAEESYDLARASESAVSGREDER